MGLFGGGGSFLGSIFGGTKPSTISSAPQASLGGQFNDIFLANVFFPQLFKFTQAASILPGGAGGALKGITKSGKGIPQNWQDIDFDKLSQALPKMQEKAQTKQSELFQGTYDTFSKIPALSDIFSKASGNVDSTGALAKIFGDLSGSALGSAASSGFLTDPVKQGNVLGPLALQKYQIEQSTQQNAQAQALGLVGAGGLPSAGAFGQSAFGVDPFTQSTLQAGGLFGGANLQSAYNTAAFNTGASNEFKQFNSGILGFSGGGGGQGGAEGQTAGLLSLFAAACWVADVLYGEGSERAMLARLYAVSHDTPFLRIYKLHGRKWAAWLNDNAWAKPLVAPIWDEMAARGAAMLRRAVA